jgi:hypothetical protein
MLRKIYEIKDNVQQGNTFGKEPEGLIATIL